MRRGWDGQGDVQSLPRREWKVIQHTHTRVRAHASPSATRLSPSQLGGPPPSLLTPYPGQKLACQVPHPTSHIPHPTSSLLALSSNTPGSSIYKTCEQNVHIEKIKRGENLEFDHFSPPSGLLRQPLLFLGPGFLIVTETLSRLSLSRCPRSAAPGTPPVHRQTWGAGEGRWGWNGNRCLLILNLISRLLSQHEGPDWVLLEPKLRESEFKPHFHCMILSFSGPQFPPLINKATHSSTSSGCREGS